VEGQIQKGSGRENSLGGTNTKRKWVREWRDTFKKKVGERVERHIQKKKWVRKWRDTSEKEAGERVEGHIQKGSG